LDQNKNKRRIEMHWLAYCSVVAFAGGFRNKEKLQ